MAPRKGSRDHEPQGQTTDLALHRFGNQILLTAAVDRRMWRVFGE